MPLTYWVDAQRNILRSKGVGELSITDLRNYFIATRGDPKVRPSMNRMMDLRDVTALPSSSEIRELVLLARDKTPGPGTRMASVAGTDLGYGVGMMFKGPVGYGERLIVVRDENEALQWIAPSSSGSPRANPTDRT